MHFLKRIQSVSLFYLMLLLFVFVMFKKMCIEYTIFQNKREIEVVYSDRNNCQYEPHNWTSRYKIIYPETVETVFAVVRKVLICFCSYFNRNWVFKWELVHLCIFCMGLWHFRNIIFRVIGRSLNSVLEALSSTSDSSQGMYKKCKVPGRIFWKVNLNTEQLKF